MSSVTGVTVMMAELLRLIPSVDPETEAAYQSYEGLKTSADLAVSLAARHPDAACVVGVNTHIEVQWELSIELLEWCERRAIPAYIYVHDYWPHHRDRVRHVTGRYGVGLLASTPFIVDSLAEDGFVATLVTVGVPLADSAGASAASRAVPKLVASVGRLVPRKRFADIVRAFCHARLDRVARLYLKLVPSHVYGGDEDAEQLRLVQNEIERGCAAPESVRIDRTPTVPHDYSPYSVYVCASGYEGFSMTPIEAAFRGCPPVMSEIPPHRAIAGALFGDRAAEFLYPVGDHEALADLLRDEIATERRSTFLAAHLGKIRATIESRWSLHTTARLLARLCRETRPTPASTTSADRP